MVALEYRTPSPRAHSPPMRSKLPSRLFWSRRRILVALLLVGFLALAVLKRAQGNGSRVWLGHAEGGGKAGGSSMLRWGTKIDTKQRNSQIAYPVTATLEDRARSAWKSAASELLKAAPGQNGDKGAQDAGALANAVKTLATRLAQADAPRPVFRSGTSGIVVHARADELVQMIFQIRLLRRTGSKLPIEVFLLSEQDYEPHYCERVMARKLNARCRVLAPLIKDIPLRAAGGPGDDSSGEGSDGSGGQPRELVAGEPLAHTLAVFFSSFENVMLLSPETLVFNRPEDIFVNEPFLSAGLVVWPSPDSDGPGKTKDDADDDETPASLDVDLGQVVISKDMHGATLLMALFLQLHDGLVARIDPTLTSEPGSLAWRLAPGILSSRRYFVRRPADEVGLSSDGSEGGRLSRSLATLYYSPTDDFHRLPEAEHRPVFVRAHSPPLNPLTLLKQPGAAYALPGSATGDGASTGEDPTSRQRHHRMWQHFSARHASNGWWDQDPEHALWYEMRTVACDETLAVRSFVAPLADACAKVSEHYSRVWG